VLGRFQAYWWECRVVQFVRFVTFGVLGFLLHIGAASAQEGKAWTYNGPEGPEKWAELEAANAACGAGLEQSPIDLRPYYISSVEPLSFDWKAQPFPMVNNGRSVYAQVAKGSTMKLGSEEFALKQILFHVPAEHAVDGVRNAMEIQFVHTQGQKKLAMVSVFVRAGDRNEIFSQLMGHAPGKLGTQPLPGAVDPMTLLPKTRGVFRYRGSLTMPPCTENVDWVIFEQPIEASQSDIDVFKLIFPMNARPLQPINRRFLLKGVY